MSGDPSPFGPGPHPDADALRAELDKLRKHHAHCAWGSCDDCEEEVRSLHQMLGEQETLQAHVLRLEMELERERAALAAARAELAAIRGARGARRGVD